MNQILMTEKKKKQKKQKGPVEIKNIVKFFAGSIIVFGVVMIGQASYAIYKGHENRRIDVPPEVNIVRVNDTAVLTVNHNVEISKITYNWDHGESTVLPEGSLSAEEVIVLPNENTTLYITIEDINRKEITYQKQFLLEGVDITKPKITIETQDGSNLLKIVATDETKLNSVTYKWNNEEEKILKPTEEDNKKIKHEFEMNEGNNKLIVSATDANGNYENIEKEIIVSSRPTINITKDNDKLIVEVTDKYGIKEITVNLNGQVYSAKDLKELKEVKVGPLKLVKGNNTISITVKNKNGLIGRGSTQIEY